MPRHAGPSGCLPPPGWSLITFWSVDAANEGRGSLLARLQPPFAGLLSARGSPALGAMATDATEPLAVQVDDLGSGLWGGRVKQVREGPGGKVRLAGRCQMKMTHCATRSRPPVCHPAAGATAAADRRHRHFAAAGH